MSKRHHRKQASAAPHARAAAPARPPTAGGSKRPRGRGDGLPCLRWRRRPGRQPRYIIHHGSLQISTKTADRAQALAQLVAYIDGLAAAAAPTSGLSTRVREVLRRHAERAEEVLEDDQRATRRRIYRSLMAFFGEKRIDEIDAASCSAYAEFRSRTRANGRRLSASTISPELRILQKAIEGFCGEHRIDWTPTIVLPKRDKPRAVFATRKEIADLLRAMRRQRSEARRHRPRVETDAPAVREAVLEPAVADALIRFILIAVYTGTRMRAILAARWARSPGSGHFDLGREKFYRRGHAEPVTTKRRPPVRLCPQLLGHLRRWKAADGRSRSPHVIHDARGLRLPVHLVNWRLRRARRSAGIAKNLTPHALRHTTVTWLLEGGATLQQVADFVGTTAAHIERTYGEWHPLFSVQASDALVDWGRE